MITIKKENFQDFYLAILKSYNEKFKNKFQNSNLASNIFKNSNSISIDELENYTKKIDDKEVKSIVNRIIGVTKIRYSRENDINLDINDVWKYISKSILEIPVEHTISSIGSQGFLSIPLFKFDPILEEFDFIRLHIWDKSLWEYMDLEKCEMFSIHTHTFFAKSWVITGELINERYDYEESSENSNHSLFKVKYNDSLNQVNRHTSMAINKNIDIEIEKTANEHYQAGDNYEIEAGKLHKSKQASSHILATFFSFTGKDGLAKSIVVGPKDIKESEVNRKKIIDPTNLINQISRQISND